MKKQAQISPTNIWWNNRSTHGEVQLTRNIWLVAPTLSFVLQMSTESQMLETKLQIIDANKQKNIQL